MVFIKKYYEDHPMGEPGVESDIEEVEARYNIILNFLEKIKPKRVLDVGTGKGFISRLMANSNNIIMSFDISSKAIKYAKCKNRKNNINYFIADSLSIPKREGILDFVVCSEVIEHIPKYEYMIREFSRVISDKGYCLVTMPNYYNFNVFVRTKITGKNTNQIYDKPIPFKKLIKVFMKNGFNLIYMSDFYIHYPFRSKLNEKLKQVFDKLYNMITTKVYGDLYIVLLFQKRID